MMFKILFSLGKFNNFLSKRPRLEIKFHSRFSIRDPWGQRRAATRARGIERGPETIDAFRERVTSWKQDNPLDFDTK